MSRICYRSMFSLIHAIIFKSLGISFFILYSSKPIKWSTYILSTFIIWILEIIEISIRLSKCLDENTYYYLFLGKIFKSFIVILISFYFYQNFIFNGKNGNWNKQFNKIVILIYNFKNKKKSNVLLKILKILIKKLFKLL